MLSIEKVRSYFQTLGISERILEFDVSSATVESAALAVGVEGERIAKTLSFQTDAGCILIVTSGDTKVDNSKFKAQFRCKAKMLPYESVPEHIGHAVGGVCPFAVNEGVRIYLDVSMRRFDTVYPACGSSNSAIELTLDELERYSGFVEWVDVCKALE